MLAKMGVDRGAALEVSPLLRAEDGRVGEATRDTAPVEEDLDSPTTSGWFASRGARVATAAVLGIVVIGCVVGGVTIRTISLATHGTSSGGGPPERAHRHRAEGVADLPEVFVVTGEDAEGPIGEWLRVDEETKAAMEAKARRKNEKKKAKAAAKLAKTAGKPHEPHRGHAEAAVGEAQLVKDLTLSSEDDAAKLARYNEDKAFKNALETDAGGGHAHTGTRELTLQYRRLQCENQRAPLLPLRGGFKCVLTDNGIAGQRKNIIICRCRPAESRERQRRHTGLEERPVGSELYRDQGIFTLHKAWNRSQLT